MANYSTLKAAVADVVKTNGTRAITGANLQSVLLSIINSIGGGGYIFKGVATPSTNAGTPDQNVFYIGGAGTYANFGTSVTVPVGSICVFKYNGSWTKETITMFAGIDNVPTVGSDNLVKSGGVEEKNAGKVDKNSGFNKFDNTIVITGKFVDKIGGLSDNADYFATRFIPITEEVSVLFFNNYSISGAYIWLYDENFVPLVSKTTADEIVQGKARITLPYSSSAKYIRFGAPLAALNYIMLINGHTMYDSYVPYNPIGGYISDIIQDVSDIQLYDKILTVEKNEKVDVSSYNIFDVSKIINGKFIDSSGELSNNADYSATEYIKVDATKQKIYLLFKDTGLSGAYIAQYNGILEVLSVQNSATLEKVDETNWNVYEINLDINTQFIRFGFRTQDVLKIMLIYDWKRQYRDVIPFNAIEKDLKKILNPDFTILKKTAYNLLQEEYIHYGKFVNKQGGLSNNADYFFTDYIPITEEVSVLFFNNYSILGAFIWLYDENFVPLVKQGTPREVGSYNVGGKINIYTPEYSVYAKYIRISGPKSALPVMLIKGTELICPCIEYNPIDGYINKINKVSGDLLYGQYGEVDELNANESIVFNIPYIWNDTEVCFKAQFISTTDFEIIIKNNANTTGLKITNTEIIYDRSGVEQHVSHGLTLSNDFFVKISKGLEYGISDISIITDGNSIFTIQNIPFEGASYSCSALLLGGSLANACLSFRAKKAKSPIWMFGDSYFTGWTKYLNIYHNFMLMGGPGGGSTLESIILMMKYCMPRMIVWCLGMNNWEEDWGTHTASYEKWEQDAKDLICICNNNDIELVFCTIPSTINHSHNKKNTFIRESGKRYIDIDKALKTQNGDWYSGYLYSDDIHLTEKGYRALASTVIAGLPELA